jgi:hypothetical protein
MVALIFTIVCAFAAGFFALMAVDFWCFMEKRRSAVKTAAVSLLWLGMSVFASQVFA